MRHGGVRALVGSSTIFAALLAGVGYLDWSRQASRESPLLSYFLLAVLPTAGVALTTAILTRRGWSRSAVVVLATLVSLLLELVSVFSVYLLSP